MYFGMDFVSSKLHEARARDAFLYYIVVEAPDEKSFWEVAERVDGLCAKSTHFGNIEMGVEREFLMADPIKFKGTPISTDTYPCNEDGEFFVKIKLTETIFVHVLVEAGICCYLEPLE